jgi:hypothetical protein
VKNKFVADGCQRFLRGKKARTSESIAKKYAAELAKTGPAEKMQIQERMVAEFLKREKMEAHTPSPATLW